MRVYNDSDIENVRRFLQGGGGLNVIFYHDKGKLDEKGERWELVRFTLKNPPDRTVAVDEHGYEIRAEAA